LEQEIIIFVAKNSKPIQYGKEPLLRQMWPEKFVGMWAVVMIFF
jgi:hypothetical protein